MSHTDDAARLRIDTLTAAGSGIRFQAWQIRKLRIACSNGAHG